MTTSPQQEHYLSNSGLQIDRRELQIANNPEIAE